MDLKELNTQRKESFRKDENTESFLLDLNDRLEAFEASSYSPASIDHPLIFTFGVPRSGTTIVTQILAHCFDLGYINNFAARFWKAPLTGVKLAESMGIKPASNFQSTFGSTHHLGEIHDFGYFWRHWLKKDDWQGIKNALRLEDSIDWEGLRTVLTNLQRHFGKAMVYKNIFGAYHLHRIEREIPGVFYVYIRRDPMDNAMSILNARKKFYPDINTWWSTMPMNYEDLVHADVFTQIAGQVHGLDRYYLDALKQLKSGSANSFIINYADLTMHTEEVMNKLLAKINTHSGKAIQFVNPPPALEFKSYPASKEKIRFEAAFKSIG